MSKSEIPQEWIKNYVDQLIRVAKELPENSVMQSSLILRADAVMDMVAEFKACDSRSDVEHG